MLGCTERELFTRSESSAREVSVKSMRARDEKPPRVTVYISYQSESGRDVH